MEQHASKTFELALFSLKKKGLEGYLDQYADFGKAVGAIQGFEEVVSYQNIADPSEMLDFGRWLDLESAKKASKEIEESSAFKKFFEPMDQVSFFEHVQWLGGLSKGDDKAAYLELYVYKVEEDRIEEHLKAKQLFAGFLKETVPGFRSLNWFQTEGNEKWQVDLYAYDLFDGILKSNQGIESHEVSQSLMSTIAELKTFKTFVPLRKDRVKYDMTKARKDYYVAKKQVQEIELGSHQHLSVKGVGAPESDSFDQAVGHIYKLAYGVKFQYKEVGLDFVVPKMEGFWYVEGGKPFSEAAREEWCWEIMIPLPDFVHPVVVKSRIDELDLSEKVELKEQDAGRYVQMLHLGSYDQEDATLEAIHGYIESNGLSFAGYHREVYLTDPRRTPGEKLKTIIRYQVA